MGVQFNDITILFQIRQFEMREAWKYLVFHFTYEKHYFFKQIN